MTDTPALSEAQKQAVRHFAELILHGDDEHKGWLTEAAECYANNQPMPPARGKGASAVLSLSPTGTGEDEIAKLRREYRPTMDRDVLHSWAADVVALLSRMEAGGGWNEAIEKAADYHDDFAKRHKERAAKNKADNFYTDDEDMARSHEDFAEDIRALKRPLPSPEPKP